MGKSARAGSYEDRREELARLRKDSEALGFEIAWETVEERRFGRHERPVRAFFSDETKYLQAIGKTEETRRFRDECALILASFPDWKPWIEGRVRVVLRELGNWRRVIGVVAWLKNNPESGLYPRQLPVFGVDTKFLEVRYPLIDELLTFPDSRSSELDFRKKWGLRQEEPLLRIRFLDPTIRQRCGFPSFADELALPITQMASLPLSGERALMVENLRNFLALPATPGCVALFGSGDALTHWKKVNWLTSCESHYWGDLDVHGFGMLSRLRGFLPEARSFLMDKETLERHRMLALPDETRIPNFDRLLLKSGEREVLEMLLNERIRLEQERLPMAHVCRKIVDLVDLLGP